MNSNLLPNQRLERRNAYHSEGIVTATALAVIAALIGYGIVHTRDFQQQDTTRAAVKTRTAENNNAVDRMQTIVGLMLAGQSNMAGRGGVFRTQGEKQWDRVVPEECSTRAESQGRVLALDANGNWNAAREPLHDGLDAHGKVVGVGPGLALANNLATASQETVFGLIPCARGESFISQWLPSAELFERMIRRAQAATENGARLDYLIWYQGENDAIREDTAMAYESNLRLFLQSVRTAFCDELKIVIIGISVSPAREDIPFVSTVRRAQKDVSMATPNVEFIDTAGLELAADGVHLTTAAQVTLGQRLAELIQSSENYK